MCRLKLFLFLFASIVWQSFTLSASRSCCVGFTRDQRLYVRECLVCFDKQKDIKLTDVSALEDGFFKDALQGLMGDDQAIAVDAVHNMLKYKK